MEHAKLDVEREVMVGRQQTIFGVLSKAAPSVIKK